MATASRRDALTVERPATADTAAAPGRASWFVHLVWFLLLAELSWAVSAVTIAMLGVFSLAPVVLATAVLTAGLWHATRGSRSTADAIDGRARSWVRVAAVVVALAATVVNGALPGEHMQTGRDGGTYTATAGWIVSDGDLIIDAARPPFDDTEGLGYFAAGFHEIEPDGPLYAQFMHAFPSMMATVDAAAGLDVMIRTNALLGGLALLMLFAFAERLVRPLPALLVQVGLAVNLVFIYFTRAPFSELLTMGMIVGGLWALDRAVDRRDRATGVVAGMLLGGTFLARLDGLVVLLMLLLALLPPLVVGRMRRVAPWVLTGMAITTAIAAVDLFVFAPFYVDLHVSFLVPLALALVAVAGIAALAQTGRGRALTALVLRHRARIALGLAVAIAVAGVVAYAVRPSLPPVTWERTTPIGFLQQQEGEPIDEARTYAEDTARWLAWYLGLPALAAGVAGWAWMTREVVAHRIGRLVPFLMTFSGLTVLYVWKPSITPDHIWADRRFLPVVLPGMLLCAAWLLDRLWARAGTGGRASAVRVAVVAAAVAVVALPALRTLPVAGLHEEAGFAAEVTAMCDRLGDDAALLLLDESGSAMHYRMTQPLRAHCGVPAAWADETISNARILELADRAGDRTLYVLAARPTALEGRPVGEPVALLQHRSERLAPTLTMPPQALESYGLDVFAAPVDPDG
jgi:hypothetical protein